MTLISSMTPKRPRLSNRLPQLSKRVRLTRRYYGQWAAQQNVSRQEWQTRVALEEKELKEAV